MMSFFASYTGNTECNKLLKNPQITKICSQTQPVANFDNFDVHFRHL